MKIYPDPELPDIEAEWYEGDCRAGTADVELVLVGIDDPAFREQLVVPCTDIKATFADVPRERFTLQSALRSTTGAPFAMYEQELDLRNGLDQRAYLYFGGASNVRVSWTFDMGATCASLGADFVRLDFASPQFPEPLVQTWICEASPYFGSLPDGTYTIVARVIAHETTVAASPPSPEVTVTFDGFTDAGTLVLSPCGSACP